ncbi:hypothetical protein BKA70DRAFT_1149671 [Coprinopsis sp. MPI-PUGE-AT-0042]|nr:hypothetical protein BKA70DRAFT_1149671 [Coprinopsis sp. MPI-PUGE-AT-0042]
MPALRQNHPALLPRNRRRSSVFTPAKAGLYTVGGMLPPSSNNQHQHDDDASPPTSLSQLPPRPISFAPNVTPITFIESDDSLSSPEDNSPGMFGDAGSQARLFPPSEGPVQPPTRRKRQPPGKRRSQGYIPRPPNAFMLFRADFVRQKHVPGSIETNHGSLSKIIGNCWRNLPLEEKKVWETRAKHEKAAHKVQYPNYRFKPVHKKKGALAAAGAAPSLADTDAASETSSSRGGIPSNAPSHHSSHLNASHGGTAISGSYHPSNTHLLKDEFKKPKAQPTEEEELRCEQMTQLLLEGKKGEELAMAMKSLDDRRRAAKARENTARFESTAPSFAGMRKYSMTPGPLMLSSGRGSMSFGAGNGLGGIMSAPQPTYPQQSPFAPGPLHMNGIDPTFFNPNDNGNAAAGSYLHLRRSSSVPLPGAYGFEGGFFGAIEDYYMGMEMDGMVAPPYSEVDVHQHQQQGNPTTMEVHTLLPPPPSGGLTGIANSSLNTSGIPSAAPTTGDSTFGGFNMGGGGFTQRLSISRHRAMLGHRRSSSAGPAFGGIARQHQQQWAAAAAAGVPYDGFAGFGNFSMGGDVERGPVVLQRDDSPLPEPDVSLFNPSFLSGGGSAGGNSGHHSRTVSMGMMDTAVDPMAPIAPSSNMVGPLAPLDPAAMGPLDPTAMGPLDGYAGDMISPSAGGAEYGGWNPDVNVGPNDAFNSANPNDAYVSPNDSYANVSPNESYANDAYSHPASSEPSPAPSYTQEYYSPNDGYAGQQEVYQQQHEYAQQQQPEAVYASHQQQQQQGYAYGPFVEC